MKFKFISLSQGPWAIWKDASFLMLKSYPAAYPCFFVVILRHESFPNLTHGFLSFCCSLYLKFPVPTILSGLPRWCYWERTHPPGRPGSITGSGRSPGGGHGNPLQSSCRENPMDRGAWWATVHRVTKSQTRLK